jgi:hypothetical protein
MKLSQGHHLAYCTNVHRGNNWSETFSSLQNEVMDVRQGDLPDAPYAIGLRLGADAARELAQPQNLKISRVVGKRKCLHFYHQWVSPWKLSWATGKRKGVPARLDGSRKG